ncbi:18542_t:CDS:2, partial [Racocetra persica]
MPIPTPLHNDHLHHNRLPEDKLHYDFVLLKHRATENYTLLNANQHAIYNTVLFAINHNQPAIIFVDGPGGSGKMFLYSVLLDKIRSSRHIVLAIASSGIVSLLLKEGVTAHSQFKILFDLYKDSICNIPHSSDLAILLQQSTLILWDEALMSNHYAFECVDRTLKDLMKALNPALKHKPFGGKVIIFGEDFHQILPVIPKGRRKDIVGFYFANWLLEIEDQCLHDLINFVYSDLNTNANNFHYLIDCAILASKNTDVSLVNSTVMFILP